MNRKNQIINETNPVTQPKGIPKINRLWGATQKILEALSREHLEPRDIAQLCGITDHGARVALQRLHSYKLTDTDGRGFHWLTPLGLNYMKVMTCHGAEKMEYSLVIQAIFKEMNENYACAKNTLIDVCTTTTLRTQELFPGVDQIKHDLTSTIRQSSEDHAKTSQMRHKCVTNASQIDSVCHNSINKVMIDAEHDLGSNFSYGALAGFSKRSSSTTIAIKGFGPRRHTRAISCGIENCEGRTRQHFLTLALWRAEINPSRSEYLILQGLVGNYKTTGRKEMVFGSYQELSDIFQIKEDAGEIKKAINIAKKNGRVYLGFESNNKVVRIGIQVVFLERLHKDWHDQEREYQESLDGVSTEVVA